MSTTLLCSGAEPLADIVPFTRVLDTQTRSALPYPGDVAAKHTGWKTLAEDVVDHTFRGDAVLANDRLTLVLRTGGTTVELYGRETTLAGPCVEIAPFTTGGVPATRVKAYRIVENTPSTVAAEVDFDFSTGSRGTLLLRLTTGQPIVEARAMNAIEELAVVNRPRYIVVPSFFGNDDVFDHPARWNAAIPAENMVLQLSVEDLMILSVWPGGAREVTPLLNQKDGLGKWQGCSIHCPTNQPLWIAVLQGHGLWHAAPLSATQTTQDHVLTWQPAFDAKWRADLTQADGYARSWYFGGPESGSTAATSQELVCPCRIEGGRAVVRVRPELLTSVATDAEPPTLLLFPMDRSRSTPLTTMLPVDVLRNTLGVGPCQYLLSSEGLATDGDPTPAAVMDEIERLFSRKRDRQSAEEIGQRLAHMTAHVAHMQDRIEHYRAAGLKLSGLFDVTASTSTPQESDARTRIQLELHRLDQTLARAPASPSVNAEGARLAACVRVLIGQANAVEEVRKNGAALRALGAQQDRTLATSRQLLRRLQVLVGHANRTTPGRFTELQHELQTLLAQPSAGTR